jgi:RNA polymerase sigma factor (sigma-70 family)
LKGPESDVLERLRNNPNEVLAELYKNYRKEFLSWSFKNFGASEADALDCFQDAMIIFYRNVADGKLTVLSSSEKTYLFSIGKNLLMRKFKKTNREVHTENGYDGITEEKETEYSELYQGSSLENRVADIVKTLRDPCRSILRFFYFRGFTMEEIAEEMNYKNAQTVKAQKVRCIKEIQNLMQRKIRTEW